MELEQEGGLEQDDEQSLDDFIAKDGEDEDIYDDNY